MPAKKSHQRVIEEIKTRLAALTPEQFERSPLRDPQPQQCVLGVADEDLKRHWTLCRILYEESRPVLAKIRELGKEAGLIDAARFGFYDIARVQFSQIGNQQRERLEELTFEYGRLMYLINVAKTLFQLELVLRYPPLLDVEREGYIDSQWRVCWVPKAWSRDVQLLPDGPFIAVFPAAGNSGKPH